MTNECPSDLMRKPNAVVFGIWASVLLRHWSLVIRHSVPVAPSPLATT